MFSFVGLNILKTHRFICRSVTWYGVCIISTCSLLT